MLKIIIPLLAFSATAFAIGKPTMGGKPLPVSYRTRVDKVRSPFEYGESGAVCMMFVKDKKKVILAAKQKNSCYFYLGEPEQALRYDKISALYDLNDKSAKPLGWIIEYKGVLAHVFAPLLLPDDENEWPTGDSSNYIYALPKSGAKSLAAARKGYAKMVKYIGAHRLNLLEALFEPNDSIVSDHYEKMEIRIRQIEKELTDLKAKYNLQRMLQKDMEAQYEEQISHFREQIAFLNNKVDDQYRELEFYWQKDSDSRVPVMYDRDIGGYREYTKEDNDAQTASEERRQHERDREANDPSFERTRHALK